MSKSKGKEDNLAKRTNERSISLHPVNFEDALQALLNTPLPKDQESEKPPRNKQKKRD